MFSFDQIAITQRALNVILSMALSIIFRTASNVMISTVIIGNKLNVMNSFHYFCVKCYDFLSHFCTKLNDMISTVIIRTKLNVMISLLLFWR